MNGFLSIPYYDGVSLVIVGFTFYRRFNNFTLNTLFNYICVVGQGSGEEIF